jgi:hypothetical protein
MEDNKNTPQVQTVELPLSSSSSSDDDGKVKAAGVVPQV